MCLPSPSPQRAHTEARPKHGLVLQTPGFDALGPTIDLMARPPWSAWPLRRMTRTEVVTMFEPSERIVPAPVAVVGHGPFGTAAAVGAMFDAELVEGTELPAPLTGEIAPSPGRP